MNSKSIIVTLTQVAVFTLAVVSSAAASTLDLDTGKALVVNQGSTGSFVFSFTNATGGDLESDFVAWVLGVQVLPATGATGTVTIGSLSAASTNSIFTTVEEITQPVTSTLADGATLNDSSSFTSMSMLGSGAATALSGASYNLGSLGLSASADALGTWNVYAVQQTSPNFQSYWFNSSLNEIDFANLTSTAGNSAILLGTVVVVPEPATGLMIGLGGVAILLRHLANRSRQAAAG